MALLPTMAKLKGDGGAFPNLSFTLDDSEAQRNSTVPSPPVLLTQHGTLMAFVRR